MTMIAPGGYRTDGVGMFGGSPGPANSFVPLGYNPQQGAMGPPSLPPTGGIGNTGALMQQGLPGSPPSGGSSGGSGGSNWTFGAAKPLTYNPGQPMGYGGAYTIPNYGAQSPWQLQALGQGMGAMADLWGQQAQAGAALGAAQVGADAQIGVADRQGNAARDVAGINAGLGRYQADSSLQGQNRATDAGLQLGLNTNDTNRQIANWQTARELEAANYGADKTLAGQKYGWDAQGNIAQIGADTQLTLADKNNALAREKLAALVGLAGGAGGAVGGDGAAAGGAAPAVPRFTPFSDVLRQQRGAQVASSLNQQNASAQDALRQGMGARGFSTNSPGFQSMLANMDRGVAADVAQSDNDLMFATGQYNAQNALPYAQAGLSQFNAEQDRALRLKLAQLAGQQGLIQTIAGSLA